MSANHLKLNANKTELLWVGSKHSLASLGKQSAVTVAWSWQYHSEWACSPAQHNCMNDVCQMRSTSLLFVLSVLLASAAKKSLAVTWQLSYTHLWCIEWNTVTSSWREYQSNNNNNNQDNIYGAVIMAPGSFDECGMEPSGRRPKTKPDDLGCVSACTGCQKLHPPSPFIIITQLKSWYSFYRPAEGRKLSRPSWLVTYRDGLPVHRWSPILVLTGSLRWSRPTRYH